MALVSRNRKSSFSNPPSPFKYHVFLSFRGEDTRKNFTDHLYTALVNAGFHTFQDDSKLERGENIKEKLESAIKQSQSSVVVFSTNYTSSWWCLDELVFILDRKRTSDHVVLLVFFDVAPSQLRKDAETLAELEIHESQSTEKLDEWRTALTEVADLAGMVLADGHQSKFIQNVVTVLQQKLDRVPLCDLREELEKKLRSAYHVHYQAEGSLLNNPGMKEWLTELKEALYGADDLLQEIKTEALRQNMENESSTSMVQEINSSLPSRAFEYANIHSRVDGVLDRLESITAQRKEVSSLEAGAGSMALETLQSTSMIEDSSVCGIDVQKEKLIKLLLSNDESNNKASVIPIVGMGGIGKTTLAQYICNDGRVKHHFKIQAWACVSENFDVLQISQQIYESITSNVFNSVNLNLLQSKIKEALEGKLFLLVLDDVWTNKYTDWEALGRPFQYGATGSKIIVTTRDEKVAHMVSVHEAHHAMPLSEEDGWSLFEKHAFRKADHGGQSDLEEIGRQIVRKCNGLPLAIKSLGGLLRSRSSKEEWKTILKSEIWQLPERENGILPSLLLSYIDLPLHLRRCFAYCALFPKNSRFRTKELVSIWKTEDLLQLQQNRPAEEVGQAYFNELFSRSFFQCSPIGNDKNYFTMHDLINDLASFVSGDFFLKWNRSTSPNTLSKTRYISYNKYDRGDCSEIHKVLPQSKYLRVILPRHPYQFSLSNLQWLRMLNLDTIGDKIKELLDSIHNLIHLRHLDLSYTPIIKLPDAICTLYNLQTLLLARCSKLDELPANLVRLINLSHLDIIGTPLKRMPPGMGNLKELRILSNFVLDDHTAESNQPELKKLDNLHGRLEISGLEHSRGLEDYILREKKFLKEIELNWKLGCHGEGSDVLEMLQPHLNLERLTIKAYKGKTLPGWSGYYSSAALVYLELSHCWNCTSLPPLGQLPSLNELHISRLNSVVTIGSEFYYGIHPNSTRVNKPFRCLHTLEFSYMGSWKEWSYVGDYNEGVLFPNLMELDISDCASLTGGLAVDRFPKLKSVKLESTQLSLYTRSPKSTVSSLERLRLKHCQNIEYFPDGRLNAPNLTVLEILRKQRYSLLPPLPFSEEVNAKSWQNLNKVLRTLTSLQRLELHFDGAEKVYDCFSEEEVGPFPCSLVHLVICHLNGKSIDGAKWFGHLNHLQELHFKNCSNLPESGLPASLQSLEIWRCSEMQFLPETGLPASLQNLTILDCPVLWCLPESGLPSSLQRLEINSCRAIQGLSESGLPTSLSILHIVCCPLLVIRCQREIGEDWPKIAHIPNLLIFCTSQFPLSCLITSALILCEASLSSLSVCFFLDWLCL